MCGVQMPYRAFIPYIGGGKQGNTRREKRAKASGVNVVDCSKVGNQTQFCEAGTLAFTEGVGGASGSLR